MSWRADLIAPHEQMISGELVLPADPGQGIVLDDAAVAAHRADWLGGARHPAVRTPHLDRLARVGWPPEAIKQAQTARSA